jgi:predicted GIY-YIG superfamily endonuclease
MPKKPMDYSNVSFYKIVPNDTNLNFVYVGHTTNFVKRKCQHKSDCNNENDKAL